MTYLSSYERHNIFKAVEDLKYILEDEGYKIEISKDSPFLYNCDFLFIIYHQNENVIIEHLDKNDYYLEFIERLSDELTKYRFQLGICFSNEMEKNCRYFKIIKVNL